MKVILEKALIKTFPFKIKDRIDNCQCIVCGSNTCHWCWVISKGCQNEKLLPKLLKLYQTDCKKSSIKMCKNCHSSSDSYTRHESSGLTQDTMLFELIEKKL